jgi:hypothetical protein
MPVPNKLLDIISEMGKHSSDILLTENDTSDVAYHSTQAICVGLAAILEELFAYGKN